MVIHKYPTVLLLCILVSYLSVCLLGAEGSADNLKFQKKLSSSSSSSSSSEKAYHHQGSRIVAKSGKVPSRKFVDDDDDDEDDSRESDDDDDDDNDNHLKEQSISAASEEEPSSSPSAKDGKSGTRSEPKDNAFWPTRSEFNLAFSTNDFRPPEDDQYKRFMDFGEQFSKVSSKREVAMLLTQIIATTEGLKKLRLSECDLDGTPCPKESRASLDCSDPGQHYYGRGYLGLKGCEKYREASEEISKRGPVLVKTPDKVATSQYFAWTTAFWYWGKYVHPSKGIGAGNFGSSTSILLGREGCLKENDRRFKMYENVMDAFHLQRFDKRKGQC